MRTRAQEKQRHKAFGAIHRAQNNEFENMRIETIVLDAYDQVIQKEEWKVKLWIKNYLKNLLH